jgi:NAD(P)-dependent dehydrogenase (short-subunit alcohol dehydrogenase family)
MTDFPTPYVSNDLSGRVALVTGTTSGLGRRFAIVLAACGAKVALTGRRADRLDALAEEIRATGGVCEPIPFDITDDTQIPEVLDKAEEALGLVDILVNNAGIPDAQRAHKMSNEFTDQVFATNLTGPWKLSCEVARRLIDAKKPGRMVNISSVGGFRYDGNGAALYSVTKSAIVRMTECLAVEWARYNINVNAIAPGAFHSEMMDGMLERIGDISKGFPRGRIGDPAQMDSTLLYFVSPASEFVTGTYVKVDDGQGPR